MTLPSPQESVAEKLRTFQLKRRVQTHTRPWDFQIPVIQLEMNRPLRTRTVGGVGGDG